VTIKQILILVGFSIVGGFLAVTLPTQWWMVLVGTLFALLIIFNYYLSNYNQFLRFLILGIVLASFELFSVMTGWPYGLFSYTDLFKPLLFGLPVSMLFIWPTVILGCNYVAKKILARHNLAGKINGLILTVLLVIGADLIIDPGAVQMGLWQWDVVGPYYGIGIQNFIGWGLFGVLGWLLVRWFKIDSVEPHMLGLLMLLAFWSSYCLISTLWIPAMFGFLLCLVFFSTSNAAESKFLNHTV